MIGEGFIDIDWGWSIINDREFSLTVSGDFTVNNRGGVHGQESGGLLSMIGVVH